MTRNVIVKETPTPVFSSVFSENLRNNLFIEHLRMTAFDQCRANQLTVFCKRCNIGRFPDNIYLFKVNNRNSTKRCDICSKLTIKKPERHQLCFSWVLLLNLSKFHTFFYCFYCWLWASKCLLGYDWLFPYPENNYLLKVNIETLEKYVNYVQT